MKAVRIVPDVMDHQQVGQRASDIEFHLEPDCFMQLRRALVDRDADAWEAIYARLRPLVWMWARRVASHPDQVEAIVNAAFTRLWKAVDATRIADFADLPSLLQYLKLCVHSVALDDRRANARWSMMQSWEGGIIENRFTEPAAHIDLEAEVLARERRDELWVVIAGCLPDRRERLLARLSFVDGLPAREVCKRYPQLFPTVGEVYRLKAAIHKRLRRAIACGVNEQGDRSDPARRNVDPCRAASTRQLL